MMNYLKFQDGSGDDVATSRALSNTNLQLYSSSDFGHSSLAALRLHKSGICKRLVIPHQLFGEE